MVTKGRDSSFINLSKVLTKIRAKKLKKVMNKIIVWKIMKICGLKEYANGLLIENKAGDETNYKKKNMLDYEGLCF